MDVPNAGASLAIKITQDGVAEAKAGLDALTASGAKAESSVTASASKISASLRAQAVAAQQQGAAVRDAMNAYNQGQASLADEQLLRRSGLLKRQTQDWYAVADAERVATEAQVARIAAEGSGLYASQAMIAKQVEAIAINEKMGQTFNTSGLMLGRLRQGFVSLTAQLTGSNALFDRTLATFGSMISGQALVLGVVAGIAAIAAAYRSLTETTRRAKEEQDKLTEALHKGNEERRKGAAGVLSDQIVAQRKALADQQKDLDEANRRIESPTFNRSESTQTAVEAARKKTLAAIAQSKQDIAEGTRELERLRTEAATNELRQNDENLARAAGYFAKDGQLRAKAVQREKDLQNQLAGLRKTHPEDLAGITALVDSIETLDNALNPKTRRGQSEIEKLRASMHELTGEWEASTPIFNDVTTAMLSGLDKQLDALRKTATEQKINDLEAEHARVTYGLTGSALEIVNNRYRALIDTQKAGLTLTGAALSEEKARIDSLHAQADALALVKQKEEDHAQVIAMNLTAAKSADEIAKQNIKTTHDQLTATAANISAQQKYADDMRGIWRDGFDRIVTDGTRSWTRMFEDILKLSSTAMKRMEEEARRTNTTPGGFQYNALQGISTAVGIGVAGYQLGHATGNSTLGALGGALTGAEMGQQFGPYGAAAGALLGAGAALLGAAKAHKEAAEAQRKAAEQAKLNLLQFNAAAGTGTALESNLAQLHAQANSLFDSIDAALPGLKNQVEREKEMAQVRADEVILAQKIIDEDKQQRAQFDAETHARLLRAQGFVREADAAAQAAADTKELNDAIKQYGATSQQVTELTAAQTADAARRAADQARADQRTGQDLGVRALRAQGLGPQADLIAFQQQQAREMEDAITAGMTATNLALLQNTLALEATAFAAQQLQAAMAQAQSDIQRDVSLGLITAQQGLTNEQNAFGFGGMTIEQIKALYTPYAGTPLTADQETLNNNIAQFLKDYAAAQSAQASATGGLGGSLGSDTYNRTAIGTVSAISDSQANGILGRLDTSNTYLGSMDRNIATLAGRSTGSGGSGMAWQGSRGGNTYNAVTIELSDPDFASLINSSPDLAAAFDGMIGRGLSRMRSGAGAPRTK